MKVAYLSLHGHRLLLKGRLEEGRRDGLFPVAEDASGDALDVRFEAMPPAQGRALQGQPGVLLLLFRSDHNDGPLRLQGPLCSRLEVDFARPEVDLGHRLRAVGRPGRPHDGPLEGVPEDLVLIPRPDAVGEDHRFRGHVVGAPDHPDQDGEAGSLVGVIELQAAADEVGGPAVPLPVYVPSGEERNGLLDSFLNGVPLSLNGDFAGGHRVATLLRRQLHVLFPHRPGVPVGDGIEAAPGDLLGHGHLALVPHQTHRLSHCHKPDNFQA